MKVLCWADTFLPRIGGMEVQVAQLLLALRERGHEFLIISGHHQPETLPVSDYLGIPIYRFPFSSLLQRRDLRGMAALCEVLAELKRHFQPDLVHIHSGFFEASFFFHLRTRSIEPAPTLVTLHGKPNTDLNSQSVLGRVLRESDWLVAVSESLLADLRELMPEITPRTSLIYNGLPLPSLVVSPLPISLPRLLCCGRLVPVKGFDLALTALASLRERYPQLKLIVAGDGPARPALEAQAASLGIGSAVQFLGWVEPAEIPALINEVTIVLMPSRWEEAFGLVALQTAQMARPIVATRVGGLPEVVVEGKTGWLVAPEDSHGLAQALASLLDNQAEAQRMGLAARQRVESLFTLEHCAEAYETLYRQLGQ